MKLIKEELLQIPNKGGIYLFTNTVNNKYYIGQAISLRKRLLTHLRNFINKRYNNPLYKALDKYGLDVFEITIIQIIDEDLSKQDLRKILDELEIKYISEYNSYNDGYNQTKGGDGGILGYKMTEGQKEIIRQNSIKQSCDGRYTVYCKNIKTGEIISGINLEDLANKLNVNKNSIKNSKSKKKIYKNLYYFASSIEELENINKIENNSKYDPTNNDKEYLIEYYNYIISLENPTLLSVANELNLSKDTIAKRNKKLREMGYELPFKSKRKQTNE